MKSFGSSRAEATLAGDACFHIRCRRMSATRVRIARFGSNSRSSVRPTRSRFTRVLPSMLRSPGFRIPCSLQVGLEELASELLPIQFHSSRGT
jgi:hypothetical protein